MITKIKQSASEKILLVFILILGIGSLFAFLIIKNKCLFVKNYNPYELSFDKPENIAVLNTNCGNVIIELRPDLAPNSVKRFKM